MVDEVKKEEVAKVAEAKKVKKLSKSIEGSVITITEAVTGTVLKYDAAKLPQAIQTNLIYHGLSQKLGDAAAGKEGQEAIDSIKKVYDGLAKGDWSVRAPAAGGKTVKSIIDKVTAMPDGAEKTAALALLKKLGL